MNVILIYSLLFGAVWAELSCECGKRNAGRINGGKETRKNEYPWMVGMHKVYSSYNYCAGTILTPWHVVTAAHCVKAVEADELVLVVGAYDINNYMESTRQEVLVEQIIKHPYYSNVTKIADLALLVTSDEIIFNNYVGPACLPSRRMLDELKGQMVKAMGWGRRETDPKKPHVDKVNKLQEVDVEVISVTQCGTTEGKSLCTFTRGKGTCRGDSGGPVVWLDPETNRFTLVGVVSHGSSWCGTQHSFQTNVSYFKDWINMKIQYSKGEAIQSCHKI